MTTTAAMRSPTPQTAILSAAAADLCALHLAPLMGIADPGVRLDRLTQLGEALAELGQAVAEERGYALAALRLPRESVRKLAVRRGMHESRVRQLLALIEGAETGSADENAAPVQLDANELAQGGAESR